MLFKNTVRNGCGPIKSLFIPSVNCKSSTGINLSGSRGPGGRKGRRRGFFPLFLDSEELIQGKNFKIGYSFISIFLFLFNHPSIVTNID